MRKMGLDLGDARIGIALTDPMGIIAGPLETYVRKKTDEDYDYIVELIRRYECDLVVIGLPVNMDGTEGPRCEFTRNFADRLRERIDVKIVFQDERLTTVTAERMLLEANMRRDKRKQVIDKVAASIILSTWMNGHS